MGNLAAQKYHIIELISAINDPALLELLERHLKEWQRDSAVEPAASAPDTSDHKPIRERLLYKPLREKFDPEAMKRAQGWSGGHDKASILQLFREMNVDEPVELLLTQLSK